MTPSRWQEIERVYNAIRDRPSAEWDAFLATACAGNEELRAEVGRLLAEKSSQPRILDRPAWEETADVTATIFATGGALDANEGEPGTFYIQGDHTGGIRFRNIRISVPKGDGLPH